VRSARGVALALVLLAAVGASQTAQSAPAQRARVLDRTLLCAIEPTGGIHELNVYGQSGVRLQEDPSKWKELASAHLNSGSIWKAGLAGVTAGRRDPTTQVASGLWYDARRCKRTTARVSLTTKGLGGGPANQWEERFECTAARQVLIRIRAEFARPTDWDFVSFSNQFGASGPPLRLGQLAAATRTGTPLAYADVNEAGRTRLFFRGHCVRGTT
jgi:hypothetical protein